MFVKFGNFSDYDVFEECWLNFYDTNDHWNKRLWCLWNSYPDIYSCSTVDENEMQIFSNGIKVASQH